MVTDEAIAEAKIEAFYAIRDKLSNKRPDPSEYHYSPPWRSSGEEWVDPAEARRIALREIESDIISLERSLRDPIQDAEMTMEINAAIALTGNYSDDPHHYMHTPLEEELFQQQIHDEVDREIRDEMGWGDYWSGPCPVCHVFTDSDNVDYFQGYDVCDSCQDEVVAFWDFLMFVTNHREDI